jgi:hypothetical protein
MMNQWQPMESAPQDATNVYVRLADGRECVAHFACDLSGEEQPGFEGWFVAVRDRFLRVLYYRHIGEPVAWHPIEATTDGAGGEEK